MTGGYGLRVLAHIWYNVSPLTSQPLPKRSHDKPRATTTTTGSSPETAKTITVSEFRSKPGEILRRVGAGERFLLTYRTRVVGLLQREPDLDSGRKTVQSSLVAFTKSQQSIFSHLRRLGEPRSCSQLAKELKKPRTTIIEAVSALCGDGWLVEAGKISTGGDRAMTYLLHPDADNRFHREILGEGATEVQTGSAPLRSGT